MIQLSPTCMLRAMLFCECWRHIYGKARLFPGSVQEQQPWATDKYVQQIKAAHVRVDAILDASAFDFGAPARRHTDGPGHLRGVRGLAPGWGSGGSAPENTTGEVQVRAFLEHTSPEFVPPARRHADLLTTLPKRLTGKLVLESSFVVDEPRGGR